VRKSVEAKQETRSRLLEAAAREFGRAGFERANVDAISLDAGYAKGTIYNYFSSKEDLFVAVVDAAG
jgi:AcrR family transcriptional regulator